jgi:fatty-acyl-CoA synthase
MTTPRNVTDMLGFWSRRQPDEVALWFEGSTMTYADLHRRTSSLALALRGAGVAEGDRVGILSANSLEWLESSVAILKAGATVVPLNTRLTLDESSYIVGHARLRMVLHSRDEAGAAQRVRDAMVPEDAPALVELGSSRYHEWCSSEAAPERLTDVGDGHPAVVGYTSGTTGRPKGVVLSHSALHWLTSVRQFEDPTFTLGVRSLSLQPLYFTACYILHFLPTLMVGGRYYSMDGLKPEYLLATLEAERINNLWSVPLVYADLAAQPGFDAADLSALVSLCTGGTRVPVEVLQRWHHKGIVLRQGYGCTETGGFTTFSTREEALRHPERAGTPIAGVRIRLADDKGDDVPLGEVGEVLVKSPAMFSGYLFAPEATAEAFTTDGWYRSGDLAVQHDDGTISIAGRKKDMIISGAVNIFPAEIERVISEVPGVTDVAVVAAAHERWDEVPVAFVTGDDVDEATILAWCSEKLQRFAVPRAVIVVDGQLPRTASGKTHKPTLREVYSERLANEWRTT